jgi:hypothetical protein
MEPTMRLPALLAVIAALPACGGNLVGTWSSAAASTRVVDVIVDGDLNEEITADTTAENDDAHSFVFEGDGTGTVTTRAIYNLVNQSYLELDTPTETPFEWVATDGGATLSMITSDGVNGQWQVSGDVVLVREERTDFSAQQYTTRTTTLTLRR